MKKEKKNYFFEDAEKILFLFKMINEARKKESQRREFFEKTKSQKFSDQSLKMLKSYDKQYPNPVFKELFLVLLNAMEKYEFSKFPSVAFSYEAIYKEYKNRYDLLKEVDLLTHTINVFELSLEQEKKLPSQIREEITILALVHDFGKCDHIKNIFKVMEDETHNQISANFLKRAMMDIGCFDTDITRMVETIKNHHKLPDSQSNINSDRTVSYFINSLNEIDHKAREKELELLKDKEFLSKYQNIRKKE